MTDNSLVGRGWGFFVAPGRSGGIGLVDGPTDIEQSILIILGTAPGERVMRPTFGCRIHELVFDPVIGETLGLAKRYIEEALGMWEPRIDVHDIVVEPDFSQSEQGKLLITITYTIRATKDERSLVYPFYLIREE